MKYFRPLLAAAIVFVCCFLVLTFWVHLQWTAAAIAGGISAAGTFFTAGLSLVKTILEIEKLKHENEKLERDKVEAKNKERQVQVATLEEMDKYGLTPRPFVANTREEHL